MYTAPGMQAHFSGKLYRVCKVNIPQCTFPPRPIYQTLLFRESGSETIANFSVYFSTGLLMEQHIMGSGLEHREIE